MSTRKFYLETIYPQQLLRQATTHKSMLRNISGGKHKNTKLLLISYVIPLLLFVSTASNAQCTTVEDIVIVNKSQEQAGAITITLRSDQPLQTHHFHLWDAINGGYVYDKHLLDPGFAIDKSIQFNIISSDQISFTNLSEGEYHLVITSKDCRKHFENNPIKVSRISR